MARIIPALWCSALVALAAAPGSPAKKKPAAGQPASKTPTAARAGELAALVRAYRNSPTPARRAAVERYAAAHAKDKNGPLARLALGVVAYENKDYRGAIAALKAAAVPQIADYAGYYLAAARVESNDVSGIARDTAPAHTGSLPSPLSGRAWLLEARALKASGSPPDSAAAAGLLRQHYAELPQPEGDVTLADCYLAANDPVNAADFYQRVYYQYISGDASARAAAALTTLKESADYPAALPQQLLQRAGRMLDAGQYGRARAEYESAAAQTAGLEHDLARAGIGAAGVLSGDVSTAYAYLRGLEFPEPEAEAERLYYLVECARRRADDDEMMAAVNRLGARFADSLWRFKALLTAANRYLLANRPDDYVPLYQAAYQAFPADPGAGACHWKVVFHAWMSNQANAADLLREHLRNYPAHATAGAALYLLGRSAERDGDLGSARAAYQRLSKTLQNTYYAILARDRLRLPGIGGAALSEKTAAFLDTLALPQSQPVPSQASGATAARIERSRLLRAAGLGDLADSELRFGARTGGQPALLAMEAAGAAEAPNQAMRIMKNMTPDYLGLPLDAAPRKFWELLFPLPYRGDLLQAARDKSLDPYLMAGLIRQESEFDPRALSRANAYGLTQVRPGTGRQYARKAGVGRFTSRTLFQPAANLKIGAAILRAMLDENGGKLEPTLAAYNAGPNRAAEWLSWNDYREPAEFVESIPFTETRDYVQAVLRNADLYKRLYGR